MNYIAIIGDIKDSKLIEDRRSVQGKLTDTLNVINGIYADDIAAKFMITLGDEFQGLLFNGQNTLKIINEIQRQMNPVKIRFGIGVGAITTDINPEMAIGADGPAYYKARESIEFVKKIEKKNKSYLANINIEIDKDKSCTSKMLNSIFVLLYSLQENWTDRQMEIIRDYESHGDSQEMCAKRLGITQSSVQRALSNSDYFAYKNAIDTVGNVLGSMRREDV